MNRYIEKSVETFITYCNFVWISKWVFVNIFHFRCYSNPLFRNFVTVMQFKNNVFHQLMNFDSTLIFIIIFFYPNKCRPPVLNNCKFVTKWFLRRLNLIKMISYFQHDFNCIIIIMFYQLMTFQYLQLSYELFLKMKTNHFLKSVIDF